MKNIPPLKPLICLLLLLLPLSGATAEDKEALAQQAAIEWLQMIDRQQYRDSWSEAAKLFKRQVSAAIWQQKMSVSRELLGDVISRKPISASYSTSLPGAPDGEYVVIQFATEFSNKKQAVETVTPMLDGKRWRVAGYYIR